MGGDIINKLKFTYGRDLMKPSELYIWSFKNLINFIRQPPKQFLEFITTLREMLALDPEEYQRSKRHLPYFLPVVFKPPYRKSENVSEIYGFVVDVDKCSRIDTHPEFLKEQLSKKDDNILLMFTSPSGDGLKVLFYFETPLTDIHTYRQFYVQFVEQWAKRHGIVGAVDTRTHDAARVCFLSYDPNLYWNEQALPISFDHAYTLKSVESVSETSSSGAEAESSQESELTKEEVPDEVIVKIKQLLELSKPRPKRQKHIFVPQEIRTITPCLLDNLEAMGLTIDLVRDIHYGVQIQFSSKTKKGEVNVFYGKRRGYTVVPTSRSTMNHEFSKLIAELIYQIIEQCLGIMKNGN